MIKGSTSKPARREDDNSQAARRALTSHGSTDDFSTMITRGEKVDTRFPVKVFQHGMEATVTFADLLTRPTVVSVYMRNNTPGCDKQNASLALHAAEFDRAGYNLIAISRDTLGSHARYAAKKKIPYTLVSDPNDLFAKASDSVIEKSMYGRKFFGPARAAYVLAADGTVLAVVEKVNTADHAAQLRELLKSLGSQRAGFESARLLNRAGRTL